MKDGREVRVDAAGVPELDVLVGPPGDAGGAEEDLNAGAVGVVVEQLQRVCPPTTKEAWLERLWAQATGRAGAGGSPLNMLLAMAPHGAMGLLLW